MMRYLVFLAAALFAMPSAGADLLYTLDFESASWDDDFRSGAWQGKVTRVTNNPHDGTYSLRGNLMEAASTDPITGLACEGNPQLEWAPSEIVAAEDSGSVYVEFAIRLDDCTWNGTMGGIGKTFYITDTVESTTAYYFTIDHNSQSARLSDNGAWFSWCVNNWGYQKAYLASSSTYGGPNGDWYMIGVLADYVNDTISFYLNGQKMTGTGSWAADHYPDGDVPLHPDFTMRGLQILYVADSQVSLSTDGAGYAVGYQLDDFRVYDGRPGASAPSGDIGTPSLTRTGSDLDLTWTAPSTTPDHYVVYVREGGASVARRVGVTTTVNMNNIEVAGTGQVDVYVVAYAADGSVISTSETATDNP